MCGIVGSLSLAADRPVAAGDIRAMAAVLAHRGPDDEGVYVDPRGRCGLGFRRLSIIDVSGGHQPLSSEDGRVWLVFNGEIYNYRALRDELVAAGHRFSTDSDSETIVHGYEQWGEAVLQRLEGMFALAIWDEAAGRLLLARDRLGKKPLVYWRVGDAVHFASEIKAILALPGVPREIDPQSLHDYLSFQYVPAPRSIFRGAAKLPPGHRLLLDHAHGALPASTPYWEAPHSPPPFTGSYEDARSRLGELLTRAVEKRLVADVPLGAFLSGGIDSSIVVGLMRRLGVHPLRTFSIGFDDPRYDESRHARRVAEYFQTEHHEEIITAEARQTLDVLQRQFDEPFADSSALPTWHVSRFARQSVTVALTGDAGDELFAGYERYRALAASCRMDSLPKFARRAAAGVGRRLPRGRAKSLSGRAARFLETLDQSPMDRYLSWVRVFAPQQLAAGYQPHFASRIDRDGPRCWFAQAWDRPRGGGAVERAVFADLVTYLPYDLLTKVDMASMSCSLECRSPMLDHTLVEFAASLPMEWRMGRSGKRILKDWARDLVPADVLTRRKKGFGVPVGRWMRGPLRDETRAALLEPSGICAAIFDAQWLRDLLESHLSGAMNHEHRLWALLMLDRWQRQWNATLT